jgi:hypothetical protein
MNKITIWKKEVDESKVRTSLDETNEIPVLSKKVFRVSNKAIGVQKHPTEVSDTNPKLFVVEKYALKHKIASKKIDKTASL